MGVNQPIDSNHHCKAVATILNKPQETKQPHAKIPVGNIEYTLTDLAQAQPPLNIAGYQIQKNFCFECPYAETLLGTRSKYNYAPRQQIYLDNEMVGDTLQVFTKTIFNTDVGPREVREQSFKIIVE